MIDYEDLRAATKEIVDKITDNGYDTYITANKDILINHLKATVNNEKEWKTQFKENKDFLLGNGLLTGTALVRFILLPLLFLDVAKEGKPELLSTKTAEYIYKQGFKVIKHVKTIE